MGNFPYLFIILIGLVSTPGQVLAYEESLQTLDVISIPEGSEETDLRFSKQQSLNQESFSVNNPSKKTNKKLCSLNRNFGPLDLGLKVNPFNINSSGLVVSLDLSYEIFNSKPNFTELTEAFKPSPNQYLINPEMRSILGKLLVSINDKFNSATTPNLTVQ
jgi:hypothetical protein